MNAAMLIFGPLAGPECRRALARGWLIIVRTLVAMLPATVVIGLLWLWWLIASSSDEFDLNESIVSCLAASFMILLTIAIVQSPALLAGSLAGERERGVLQLLLTTAATARDVVVGRFLGKLSQVTMILLAGLPLIALLSAWGGFGLLRMTLGIVLTLAAAFGGGGMAVGASVLSRRGRDALLSVYIVIACLLAVCWLPGTGLPVPALLAESFDAINPYITMNRLVWREEMAPALVTSVVWVCLGVAGIALASVRLRGSCLSAGDIVKKSGRSGFIPAIGERPMLWKELYIERVGTLGRFGRWLGILLTLGVGGGSVFLAGAMLWDQFHGGELGWILYGKGILSSLDSGLGRFMGWLLQWAIGLRAAVSIASERERGSWDGLLMSPLEPGEMVQAKLYGSIRAIAAMAIAFVLAWTIARISGAVGTRPYVEWLAATATGSIYMAAVGVRCSLAQPSATRAMTWTIALWLVAVAFVAISAFSLIMIGAMIFLAIWQAAVQYLIVPITSSPWFPMSFRTAWPIATGVVTLFCAGVIELDTRLRFDRLAGRMAGGKLATSIDEFLHGRTNEPVFLPKSEPWLKIGKRTAEAIPAEVPALPAALE